METSEFRKQAHSLVDWMADFLERVDTLPVKPDILPGHIYNQLPDEPPQEGTKFENIFKDFEDIIMPGMTHWQHPNFHAYFNANSSPPSILAEMLTATLGAQCMIWDTSPAAAELEEQTMDWLNQMLGLPRTWKGVIQDTASTSTLIALLSAREKVTSHSINEKGFSGNKFRVYCTNQTHSSTEKAAKIAGIGRENVVKVDIKSDFSMDASSLQKSIREDRGNGYVPMAVVSSLGTTGLVAIDDLDSISKVTETEKVWHHVDAAFAGTALLVPEYRYMLNGIERCDSFVFNPHKWMFVNFDCTAYFVKDADQLVKTFSILPEYLQTQNRGEVNDYRDWGIALGRRFRALKLWFVIRSYGVTGLQEKIKFHIHLAKKFEIWIDLSDNFEIVYPRHFNFFVFRFRKMSYSSELNNSINKELISRLNKGGKMYLSHISVNDKYSIRMVIGQTNVTLEHIKNTWSEIVKVAKTIEFEKIKSHDK